MIRFLANEYDDTSCALFPFLGSYLQVLKKLKKINPESINKDNLAALLRTLIFKMKYDEDEEYKCGPDAGEDEALFIDLRKVNTNLRKH